MKNSIADPLVGTGYILTLNEQKTCCTKYMYLKITLRVKYSNVWNLVSIMNMRKNNHLHLHINKQ